MLFFHKNFDKYMTCLNFYSDTHINTDTHTHTHTHTHTNTLKHAHANTYKIRSSHDNDINKKDC